MRKWIGSLVGCLFVAALISQPVYAMGTEKILIQYAKANPYAPDGDLSFYMWQDISSAGTLGVFLMPESPTVVKKLAALDILRIHECVVLRAVKVPSPIARFDALFRVGKCVAQ